MTPTVCLRAAGAGAGPGLITGAAVSLTCFSSASTCVSSAAAAVAVTDGGGTVTGVAGAGGGGGGCTDVADAGPKRIAGDGGDLEDGVRSVTFVAEELF